MPERIKLGMLLFIVSEGIFFLLLVMAYVFYHRSSGPGPTAASVLDPVKTGLFSVALFSSSATAWLAGLSLRKEKPGRFGFWLAGTIVLGAVFLAGQGAEYAHLLGGNVTISRDLFGTTFFTLTGFHGFHVFVGLAMLAVLLGMAIFTRGREPSLLAMDVVSMYWHFVDAVWVVIFSVVYLWAFL